MCIMVFKTFIDKKIILEEKEIKRMKRPTLKLVQKSSFTQRWINTTKSMIMEAYPDTSEEFLDSFLEDVVMDKMKIPNAWLDNNYKGTRTATDLVQLYEYYLRMKPIIAGNGTLFLNHDKSYSPIQDVIDDRIADRKKEQRIRDTFPQGSYEYKDHDRLQMEAKIKINAIYGSFGTTTFQLYNVYTAGSTTGTAQSLISTTAIAFEAFLSNNAKFKNYGECATLIHNVKSVEERTIPINNLNKIDDVSFMFNYLKNQFETWDDSYAPLLMDLLNSCDVEDLTRIYYKNNIYKFTDNAVIQDLIATIFNKLKSFRNPNEIPDNVVKDLDLLWSYYDEFVFYNHAYIERINRLKNDKRKSVTVIDTDSNMINVEPWVRYLKENIIPQATSIQMDEDDTIFACVNLLAFLVTKMVRKLLNKYCTDCNVLERYHSRVNMKNEFYFRKMLLSGVKKRYVASIRLKEGKEMIPEKIEIKGHDFKKAGVNEDIQNELESIIKDCILDPEIADIGTMLKRLDTLENGIRDSLRNGERKYLLRLNCKTPNAYANPMSQGAVLSVLLWNTLVPNNEISIPDKLDVVLINIPNERTIVKIKDSYPDMYERFKRDIFGGDIDALKQNIKYLALPNDGSSIPDWIQPFIDVDKIVARNIGTFRPILEALGFSSVSGGGNDFFSNILSIE